MHFNFKVPEEAVDSLIQQILVRDREWVLDDIKKILDGGRPGIVSFDPVEDLEFCYKRLAAYDVMLEWYGFPEVTCDPCEIHTVPAFFEEDEEEDEDE